MYTSTLSLTSALDGVEGPRHSGSIKPPPPRGRPGIGCWVGPRDGLDKCGKSHPHRFFPQTIQPTASHYTNYATLSITHM